MFTGIIQSIGRVIKIHNLGKDIRIWVLPNPVFKEIIIGESIAVNGACLTVESFENDIFSVYISKESLERTNLKTLTTSCTVNLERALRLQDRLGGHILSGHIDCLSCVTNISFSGKSLIYRFKYPSDYSKYVIEKGSIALDGISLTVNKCGMEFFEVNIIPETQKNTTTSTWKVGTLVNTEFDLIGKYVEKIVRPWNEHRDNKQGVTMDFLREHGF